jgi:hypothetical protein
VSWQCPLVDFKYCLIALIYHPNKGQKMLGEQPLFTGLNCASVNFLQATFQFKENNGQTGEKSPIHIHDF